MPGIIPMKLIKCGSSQTRIAQACDRCRSKKIRCDGVRPCCSQCANVGFECKTSDKLSRRAFPRGYTESLEERVRTLEREVRELKELLDAKDEQLDMLSRIHSFSPYSPPASSASGNLQRNRKSPESLASERSGRSGSADVLPGEIITVAEPTGLIRVDGGDGLYMGASSGRAFVELLRQRLGDAGHSTEKFEVDGFFKGQKVVISKDIDVPKGSIRAPPTLLSDQLVQGYFQEYHLLFPVLHRPSFLGLYQKLVNDDGAAASTLKDHEVAQLFLVFATAHQHLESRNEADQQVFDIQWQRALNAILSDNSITTVQCLVLAQLYYMSRGDYAKLLHYKSLAVGVSMRLGLNQNQSQFSFGTLDVELRKRAFWCVFTIDVFSAAMLGLPQLLNMDDIETELPSDVDDHYISEQGFLSNVNEDQTKIPGALALFRLSRVLAHVLEVEYSRTASREVSHARIRDLEDELDRWRNTLPQHLRMEFTNGSPATNQIHRASPVLGLAYNYIRVIINRPVVGSVHAHLSSASLLVMRESSKCILQIFQLLTERHFGFAFCLNRAHVLMMAGFTFMYSAMEVQRDGMLAKENRKLIHGVLEELQLARPALARQVRQVAIPFVGAPTDSNTSAPSQSAVSPTAKFASPDSKRTQQKSPKNTSVRPHPSSSPANKQQVHHRSNSASYITKSPNDPAPHFPANTTSHPQPRLMAHPQSNLQRSHSVHHSSINPKPDAPPLHHRHSISYDVAPTLDFTWPMEGSGLDPSSSAASSTTTLNSSPPISAAANSAVTDDWERVLAMIDASHAAHIYGDAGGTLVTAHTPTVPVAARLQFQQQQQQQQQRAAEQAEFDAAAMAEAAAAVEIPAPPPQQQQQQQVQRQQAEDQFAEQDALDFLGGVLPRVGQQPLVAEGWM